MRPFAGVCVVALMTVGAATAHARDIHVDSARGDDAADGRSARTAWRTLDRLERARLEPGTRVLLHAGSRWRGRLRLVASGTAAAPIVVQGWGRGAMPRIDASGIAEDAVALLNASHVRVTGLEIVNRGDRRTRRRGVLIAADDAGTVTGVRVDRLYIHDIGGSNDHKDNGGIVFRTTAARVPSRFVGLTIERNIVWRVDRSGIVGSSDQLSPVRWFPSLGVVIRDNYVDDIGGDGITPWATDGALVEHNIVRRAVQRAPGYNAGLWQWSTDNTLFQLNDVAGTRGTLDGQGYDSDYNSRGTRFLLNYSHGNDGGFLLVCTPVRRDTTWNIGNTGTIVRWNISRHDGERGINLSGADDVTIERNAIYASGDTQMVLTSPWDGWSTGIRLRDNLFATTGVARYGHGARRDEATGRYTLAAGWGGARDIRFSGNRLIGRHAGVSTEAVSPVAPMPLPDGPAWTPPAFDPKRPATLARFLADHRRWMLALMMRQFGGSATPSTPAAAPAMPPRHTAKK